MTVTNIYNIYNNNCSKVIAQYLQPLVINKYTIPNTLSFPDVLRENVLESIINVDSLFNSTPLGKTIDFIFDKICV